MRNGRLIEISRKVYGHDRRAINRHSERRYRDTHGNHYILSRTADGCPPFFEAYGPFGEDHEGLVPRLLVDGREYWGDGWSWSAAVDAFTRTVHARIGGSCPGVPKPRKAVP